MRQSTAGLDRMRNSGVTMILGLIKVTVENLQQRQHAAGGRGRGEGGGMGRERNSPGISKTWGGKSRRYDEKGDWVCFLLLHCWTRRKTKDQSHGCPLPRTQQSPHGSFIPRAQLHLYKMTRDKGLHCTVGNDKD